MVNNNAQMDKLTVSDLMTDTRYNIRITAHNSAGSTTATYSFTTSPHGHGRNDHHPHNDDDDDTFSDIANTDLIVHSDYGPSILTDVTVIIPLIISITVTVVVVLLIHRHVCKTRRMRRGELS